MPSTSTAVRASGARRSSSRRPVRRTSRGGSRRRSAASTRRSAPRNAGNWWSVVLVALGVLGAIAWSTEDGPATAEPSCSLPGSAVTIAPEQAANAALIAGVAWDRGLPDRAVVIALATAQQESGLRNLDYGDRDSLGLFQQRPSQGWGTEAQVTDPLYAAGIFFDRLVGVPGWETASCSFIDAGGLTDSDSATYTIVAPPNTAPSVALTGVTNGASYEKGNVPAATCDVTDAEEGAQSFAATLSAVSGPHAADGIGSQTASCAYTDGGGLSAPPASATYSITDGSAPVIAPTMSPATPDGANGWYRSDVSLTWDVSEPQSPSSLTTTGCAPQQVTADQPETTYSCSASSAGGSTGPVEVSIKRDTAGPSVAYSNSSGTSGSNGWYTSAVTATFTAMDTLSGPGSATGTGTSTGEGIGVEVRSPAFSDAAGNTTPAGAAGQVFSIDLSNPTATFDQAIGTVTFGTVPPAPTCTAADNVSGAASCTVTGYSTAVGTHTLTATATDNAGRTGTATLSYTVLPLTLKGFYSPVDLNGVLNTVKGGSSVPLKFEVFSGSTELTTTTAIGASFSTKAIACPNGTTSVDEIEVVSTGGTSLRFDSTAGQFIQNWATPKKPGTCWAVTMTTQDLSKTTAHFMLK